MIWLSGTWRSELPVGSKLCECGNANGGTVNESERWRTPGMSGDEALVGKFDDVAMMAVNELEL